MNSKRRTKRVITLIADSCFIATSFWAALVMRLDDISVFSNTSYWFMLSGLLPMSLIVFIKLGLYRSVLRYMSSQAVRAIVAGAMLSTGTLVLIAFFFSTSVPLTVPLIYCAIILLTVGGARLVIRALVSRFSGTNRCPVVIYGAGSAGRQLAMGIATGPEFYVSAFLDDNETKLGIIIQGVPVIPLIGLKPLIDVGKARKVLLALPSASRSTRNKIIISDYFKYILQNITGSGSGDRVIKD